MKSILLYLAQVVTASGILYSYYHFFLRNKKFHRHNRYYLLLAVLVSIFIPLLNFPIYFSKEATENSVVLQTLNVISSPSEETTAVAFNNEPVTTEHDRFSWQNIIYSLYLLLVSGFILRIILSVRKIRIITRNYPSEKIGNINFVNTTEPGTPFSFFRWLFWNRDIEIGSDRGQQIFRHELFHIQQRHSVDLVFIEFITAIGWFNPFFYLIKKELKTIHEFLADEFAMQKTECWKYAELLLMQALNTRHHLVNPFFHNQIKRRIAMITSSQKPGHQYLRKLLVLPVAAVIAALFAFSYKNRNTEKDLPGQSNEPITIVVDPGHGGSDKGARALDGTTHEAGLTLEISKKIQELASEYNINVVMTRKNEEFPEEATDVSSALRRRVEISNKVNPVAFVSVHVNAAGAPGKPTNRSGFELFISNRKETENDKRLATSVLNEVSKLYKTDINIKLRTSKGIFVLDNTTSAAINIECGYINNPKDLVFITDKTNQEKIARAILSGVKWFATNKFKNNINTGYDPPIIDTPKFSQANLKDSLPPLVYVDGNFLGRMNASSLDKQLEPNSIKTINVLKGVSAINKYGEQGRNGVIEITTKKTEVTPKDTLPSNSKLGEIVVTTTKTTKPDNNIIFEKVETEPDFPGGVAAWRKYLEKNLDAGVPLRNGAKEGAYTVQVRFLVNENGEISSIKALTSHGHGMEEEVIRVIAKGPNWNPGSQNGKTVNAYKTQPVTFVISKDTNVKPKTPITVTKLSSDPKEFPKVTIKELSRVTAYDLTQLEPGTDIDAFTFTIDKADGSIMDYTNMGADLKPKTRELMSTAAAGRMFTIDNIQIIKDGVKKKIPSKVYYVTG
jgi:N-acetylmuramoyl-L-alanine amidase